MKPKTDAMTFFNEEIRRLKNELVRFEAGYESIIKLQYELKREISGLERKVNDYNQQQRDIEDNPQLAFWGKVFEMQASSLSLVVIVNRINIICPDYIPLHIVDMKSFVLGEVNKACDAGFLREINENCKTGYSLIAKKEALAL